MEDSAIDLQLDRAHTARMYDYYLGGRTNFIADREAVGRILSVFPAAMTSARANRAAMHRSTRFLVDAGLRQFLDIGTGIPTRPNLHEVAQAVAPECRVVYVDNDPIVLAHAQALLCSTPQGRTAYVQADLTEPDSILKAPELLDTLNLSEPVALSLNAVLHFITDDLDPYGIVDRLKDALAPGSALVISHGTGDFTSRETMRAGTAILKAAGTSAQGRSRAEFTRFFAGWQLVEPGVTTTHRWRPDPEDPAAQITDEEASCYVGVAFKPVH